MVEETEGWFVRNVSDATWRDRPDFCPSASFETEGKFPEIGVNLFLLKPGKPNCRYHRENGQEDFLVLSGRCTLLINEQERKLGPWDFVHCPAGVTHVFVGAGDGPCALLAIGRRLNEAHEYFYPQSELARRHGAEAPEPTPDPRVAYADVAPPVELDAVEWPSA